MIYIHKILPYFFMPLTLAILVIATGWILKRRGIVLSGLCVLYLFSIPLTANALLHFIEGGEERLSAPEAPPADAIVVLSGSGLAEKGKSKVLEWNDPDRFFGGVQLFNSGKAPLLLFTGGWLPWDPGKRLEGEVLVEQARLMGVPADSTMTTGRVSNTEEEANATAQMLCDQRKASVSPRAGLPRKILLVTSAYHMQRAQRLFERAGLEVVPFPVDYKSSGAGQFSVFDLLPSADSLAVSETVIREIYGRLYYRLRP